MSEKQTETRTVWRQNEPAADIGLEDLLTMEEMAQVLKVPVSWLYSRTREKGTDTIPCVRVGKYIRLNRPAVIAWTRKRYGKREL